mmetsp:Transcript_11403/g.24574  ORF Transcript_11403/g.24574 Transcript_11403/m.24574 type:complete len:832 (+) Transcript_11403:1481-3976(+)
MAADARHGPSEDEGPPLPPSSEREGVSPAGNSDASFETSRGGEFVAKEGRAEPRNDDGGAPASPNPSTRPPLATSSPSSSSSSLRSWRRRRYPPDATPDFARPAAAAAMGARTAAPRRCYRLNLERPFDLHCEPSPLEYGDYMTPWGEGALPPTVGPVEYCPPRHLGGRGEIWRELLAWERRREDEAEGEETNRTAETDEARATRWRGGGWRKLTPAEERAAKRLGERDPVSGEYTFEAYDWSHVVGVRKGRRGTGKRAEDATGTAGDLCIRDSVRSTNGLTTLKEDSLHHHHHHHCHRQDDPDSIPETLHRSRPEALEHPSRSGSCSSNDSSSSSSDEEAMHPNAMFASNPPFQNRDEEEHDPPNSSSHPTLPFRTGPSPPVLTPHDDDTVELRTVVSLDSETSREEVLRLKTDDELAEDTARLFRRSELSLREARERREAMEAEERRKREREERERSEKEGSGGFSRSHGNGSGGNLRRKSSLSLGSTKKLLRSLSKVMSELNGTPSNAHSNNRTGSGTCIGPGGADRKASLQAATIEKARDLIDDDDDCDDDDPSQDEGPDTPRKARLNISLYILGEYDVLNDLVNDGAKRLSRGKDASDWELLRQNEPCPPPDRWVRPTGWIRCNPSCGYAAFPPEGYDVDGRKNGARIREMEGGEEDAGDGAFSNLTSSSRSPSRGNEEGGGAASPSASAPPPEPPVSESTSSPKHSYGTHATDSTAAPSTSTEGDGDAGEVVSNRSSGTGNSSASASPDGSSSATAPSPHPTPIVTTPVPTKCAPPTSTPSMSVAASHFNSKPSGGGNDGMVSSATMARKSLGKRFAMFGKKNRR